MSDVDDVDDDDVGDDVNRIPAATARDVCEYLVKAVVEAHGGSVEVSSQPDSGSTFTVRLPNPSPM